MVAEKIFLVIGLDEYPVPASFKVTEEAFITLTENDGISQAPYFAKRQWVRLKDIEILSESDWKLYIDESYRLVASKLSKTKQRELGLID